MVSIRHRDGKEDRATRGGGDREQHADRVAAPGGTGKHAGGDREPDPLADCKEEAHEPKEARASGSAHSGAAPDRVRRSQPKLSVRPQPARRTLTGPSVVTSSFAWQSSLARLGCTITRERFSAS